MEKTGWQGCALYIIHAKIHPKIGIFSGILQKCSILPTFDDLYFHDRVKVIENFSCFNILDVFKCILTVSSIDLKILDFGGQIRPLPHIVRYYCCRLFTYSKDKGLCAVKALFGPQNPRFSNQLKTTLKYIRKHPKY